MSILSSILVVLIAYIIALVTYWVTIGSIKSVAIKYNADKDAFDSAKSKTFKVLKLTGCIYFIPLVLVVLSSEISMNITLLVTGLTVLSVFPFTKKILIPRLRK